MQGSRPPYRQAVLRLRPVTLADAAFVADVQSARRPDDPADPKKMAHYWRTDDPEWTNERFIVERDGRAVGYALQAHAPWVRLPRRYARIRAELMPPEHQPVALADAYALIEDRARRDGGELFSAEAREDDAVTDAFLRRRGYREDRRSRCWELDLVANRERLASLADVSRARMRDQGIRVLTIDRDPDAEKFHRLHELREEAAQDVPRTIPHVRQRFEIFMRWFDSPAVRKDRMWIARAGRDLVGVSVLSYPPVRGNVWTDWTGTARKARGRGVARALKLETVMQAISLRVTRVRTENDGENAPILHLNADMGYVRVPGWIQYLKDAS